MQCARRLIDIASIRLIVNDGDIRAGATKDFRRDSVRSAESRIEDDASALQRVRLHTAQEKSLVLLDELGTVAHRYLRDRHIIAAQRAQFILDLLFDAVRNFHSVVAENLHAVVREWIV